MQGHYQPPYNVTYHVPQQFLYPTGRVGSSLSNVYVPEGNYDLSVSPRGVAATGTPTASDANWNRPAFPVNLSHIIAQQNPMEHNDDYARYSNQTMWYSMMGPNPNVLANSSMTAPSYHTVPGHPFDPMSLSISGMDPAGVYNTSSQMNPIPHDGQAQPKNTEGYLKRETHTDPSMPMCGRTEQLDQQYVGPSVESFGESPSESYHHANEINHMQSSALRPFQICNGSSGNNNLIRGYEGETVVTHNSDASRGRNPVPNNVASPASIRGVSVPSKKNKIGTPSAPEDNDGRRRSLPYTAKEIPTVSHPGTHGSPRGSKHQMSGRRSPEKFGAISADDWSNVVHNGSFAKDAHSQTSEPSSARHMRSTSPIAVPSGRPASSGANNSTTMQSRSIRLFVGRIPKSYKSGDLKRPFDAFGEVIECNIIRDKKTGQSRGCGFVRFGSLHSGMAAVHALNQSICLDTDLGPMQVKYAAGELERLRLPVDLQPGGECVKVFFGNLAQATTENDMLHMFADFGEIEELCILKDRNRKSKCSGFVTFKKQGPALAAIQALNTCVTLPGAIRPMEVRLAESKAQRAQRSDDKPSQQSQSGSYIPTQASHLPHPPVKDRSEAFIEENGDNEESEDTPLSEEFAQQSPHGSISTKEHEQYQKQKVDTRSSALISPPETSDHPSHDDANDASHVVERKRSVGHLLEAKRNLATAFSFTSASAAAQYGQKVQQGENSANSTTTCDNKLSSALDSNSTNYPFAARDYPSFPLDGTPKSWDFQKDALDDEAGAFSSSDTRFPHFFDGMKFPQGFVDPSYDAGDCAVPEPKPNANAAARSSRPQSSEWLQSRKLSLPVFPRESSTNSPVAPQVIPVSSFEGVNHNPETDKKVEKSRRHSTVVEPHDEVSRVHSSSPGPSSRPSYSHVAYLPPVVPPLYFPPHIISGMDGTPLPTPRSSYGTPGGHVHDPSGGYMPPHIFPGMDGSRMATPRSPFRGPASHDHYMPLTPTSANSPSAVFEASYSHRRHMYHQHTSTVPVVPSVSPSFDSNINYPQQYVQQDMHNSQFPMLGYVHTGTPLHSSKVEQLRQAACVMGSPLIPSPVGVKGGYPPVDDFHRGWRFLY